LGSLVEFDCTLLLVVVILTPCLLILLKLGCFAIEVPWGVHHLDKVSIVVNRGRDVVVVFHELIKRYLAIRVWTLAWNFESSEEIVECFSLSFTSFNNGRVVLYVIDTTDVLKIKEATSIFIKFWESLTN
jgi:hypothetical protein